MSSTSWIEYGKSWDEFSWPAHLDGAGLAKPGVEIETDDGERLLIGDINELGGICDDCEGVRDEAIVARYRVLLVREASNNAE